MSSTVVNEAAKVSDAVAKMYANFQGVVVKTAGGLVKVEKDKWVEGNFKKAVTVIGYIKKWDILAYDPTVKAETLGYLKNKLVNGETVNVKIDEGELFQVECSAYILNLRFNLEGKINLTLQQT